MQLNIIFIVLGVLCMGAIAHVPPEVMQAASSARLAQNTPKNEGPPPEFKDMMMCTACERVMGVASKEVAKRLHRGQKWSKKVGKKLIDSISQQSCGNPELFGDNQAPLLEGCANLFANYYEAMKRGIRKRLSPKYEEYEEDIVPREFCEELGACTERMMSFDTSMRHAQAKEERKQLISQLYEL